MKLTARDRLIGAWKRLPEPIRREAHELAARTSAALVPLRVARYWRRGRRGEGAVTVLGLHRSAIGLGRGARLFAQALAEAGAEVRALDAGQLLLLAGGVEELAIAPAADERSGGVVISHLNPPELARLVETSGARFLKGRRHVGFWAWELPVAPESWRPAFNYVDEVWCPSAFTADAVRAIAPARVPVRVVHHPMFLLADAAPDRARFGLAEDVCAVLVAFDIRSTAARKNAFGALETFERAFPEAQAGAVLVCKILNADASPEVFAQLTQRFARRPDVHLVTERLTDAEMFQLVASVDVVLSLHRAEGFGLLLAEAMQLGKPVIATAWSGNMDFMDGDSAALVGYRLAPVLDPQGIYRDSEWAEPDLDEAAQKLKALLQDGEARAALGRRARARARAVFDRTRWTERVLALLNSSHQGVHED